MTIKEYIIANALKASKAREQKLEEIDAPEIVIAGQRKYSEQLENGELKISGDVDTLAETVETVQPYKGRNGKCYYIINSTINFFPNAKYGMYIKRA